MSDPLFDVAGRVVVVTGGLGQLGATYAAALAERGAKVAMHRRVPADVLADEVRAH